MLDLVGNGQTFSTAVMPCPLPRRRRTAGMALRPQRHLVLRSFILAILPGHRSVSLRINAHITDEE